MGYSTLLQNIFIDMKTKMITAIGRPNGRKSHQLSASLGIYGLSATGGAFLATGLEGSGAGGGGVAGGFGVVPSFLGGSGDSPGGVVCGMDLLAEGTTAEGASGKNMRSGAALARISLTWSGPFKRGE